jgi:hypothetical protein
VAAAVDFDPALPLDDAFGAVRPVLRALVDRDRELVPFLLLGFELVPFFGFAELVLARALEVFARPLPPDARDPFEEVLLLGFADDFPCVEERVLA